MRQSAAAEDLDVVRKILAHTQQRPDATALVDDDLHVTYAALHTRARRIEAALRAHGVGLDDRVGLYAERSIARLCTLAMTSRSAASTTMGCRMSALY